MASGRAPSLTSRGRMLLGLAGALWLAGAAAGVWLLCGLGVALAASLGVVWLLFFPSAALVWRRHVDLAWSVHRAPLRDEHEGLEGPLSPGRPFTLRIRVRNRGLTALGTARIRVVAASSLEFGEAPPAAALGASTEVIVRAEGRALAAGFHLLHGAAIAVSDRLGLATIEAYFPSPLTLQVFPRAITRLPPRPRRAGGGSDERTGENPLRLRGLAGSLRELREHAPGDPFKQIAWKATARLGRLMVRDLDREAHLTHHVLLDLGATLRIGPPGRTGLDHSVELAAAFARAALGAGDRVGLITYDARVHTHLAPGEGKVARARIALGLMEALTPIDEDQTELTDGELVAGAARYLRHQEGRESRLPRAPAIDDPSWSHIATGPDGALYDLRVLGQAADAALREAGRQGRGQHRSEPALASDPDMARLRGYCRLRGIELPPRRGLRSGRRARGLAKALELSVRGRGVRRIVIFSDLEELDDDLLEVSRWIALARRRGHRLVCITPHAPGSLPDPEHSAAAEIVAWERRRREAACRRRLVALGVTVLAAPTEAPRSAHDPPAPPDGAPPATASVFS